MVGQVRGPLGAARDLFRSSPAFRTGSIILLILLALGALSIFAPYGPTDRRVVPNDRSPSFQYPFGTTSLGQDVFWLTTFAIRNSLFVAGLASSSRAASPSCSARRQAIWAAESIDWSPA